MQVVRDKKESQANIHGNEITFCGTPSRNIVYIYAKHTQTHGRKGNGVRQGGHE